MLQTSSKGIQDKARLGGRGDPLEIAQKLKFDHTTKWLMHTSESLFENAPHKILWDIEIHGSPNPGQKTTSGVN